MSSRLSLGGASRSVLRDSSSRYNSSLSRRQSFGGGGEDESDTPKKRGLLDLSGVRDGPPITRSRASSAPRRQSYGGDALRSETPTSDRRAMLAAWRQARTGGRDEPDPKKRTRDAPPLPPSGFTNTPSSIDHGSRKQHKVDYEEPLSLSQNSGTSQSVQYYDDDSANEANRSGTSHLSARTPLGRRRGLGSARRQTLLGRSTLYNPEDTPRQEMSQPLSQLTVESDTETHKADNFDSVEGAGLLSQVERMKQRVEQLEKEKMELSMSKAPLEARFRQKEDAWLKEQNRMLQEIDTSRVNLREADERYRDLQVKYDSIYDECMQLRQEVRKASSVRQNPQDNSIWSRQLQNDRDLADMKEKLRAAEEEISSIRLAKVSLEKELHATQIELRALERNYDELQAEYDDIAAKTSDNNEAEIKLEVLTNEHMATSAQLNAVCADLASTKARADAAMEAKEERHKREIEQLSFEMTVLKARAGKINDEDKSIDVSEEEDDAVLRARIEERDKRIAELECQILKGEQLRRQMHNCIQELRGNIRVYVRTRPFLPGDGQSTESPVDVSPDGESLGIMDKRNGATHEFKFDKIFPPSAGQDLVFQEVSDFVQSALDGYHVCLFSYGQTGSGKTHTMQGCGNGAMRGVIPRSVEQILTQAKAMNQQKWRFTVSASFLEIYNEDLKDLLVTMNPAGSSKDLRSQKLAIKRNREGKSYVESLTEVPIDVNDSCVGMDQLATLMGVASRSRSVASTKMNSQSSRSHSVFILNLHGYNEDSGAIVNGALNLCDLAGSERLDRSGAGADAARLKETQAINKSLSCLGDVFNALATGAPHVPYRNSKLTYLLQDCLSGDGKALMFVNLSPTTASSNESLCSLRFAQRVNQVELGKATKHIEYTSSGKR